MKKNITSVYIVSSIEGALLKFISVTLHTFAKNIYFILLVSIEGQITGTVIEFVLCILASFGGIFLRIHVSHFTHYR